ncbi:wolframin [Procambarus clarkii]|uniref:wolframin n=1 Tax=Procambarus clarkii TaxID=6728 RepID=UPI001E6718C0|nr:wolframin-like [Procambarus clarkii]
MGEGRMAATLPSDTPLQEADSTSKKTSRRQWSVQGGPRGLLRRMRSQLAEDGCPESQLVMGKTLLEQQGQENEADEEGARLAVFWLTQASLQGNSEATQLLQNCLDNNIGICEHNYHEVRECLAKDLQEKLARRAAHMLFCSVSDGNDVISSSGLASKIREVLAGVENDDVETVKQNHQQPEDCCTLEERYGGERFSEEHVVSGSVLYCQGRVPPLHYFINLTAPSPYTSYLLQAIHWPYRTLERIYQSYIHFLGVVLTNYVKKCLGYFTPIISGLVIFLLGSLMSLFGAERAAVVLPLLVSCISLIVMIVSSVHMLINRKRFISFHIWSLVFSHYCPELDINRAEGKFKARCWKPYVATGVAVFFYLGTVPLTSPKLMIMFLPVICMCAVITFALVPERLSGWHFLSLVVYISAMTPSVHGYVGHWLVSVSRGTGLEYILAENHINVLWKLKLHFGVGPMLHVLWFVIQLGMAVCHGVTRLSPHLVSVVWCHLALIAYQKVTMPMDILYPIAGWCALIFLPTFTPFMLLGGPALLCACLGLYIGMDYQALMLIFFSVVLLVWVLTRWLPNFIVVCKWMVVGVMLLALLHPSLFVQSPPSKHSILKWENYKNVCVPSKDSTAAATVHGCLPLLETLVKWQGSVAQVNIVSVYNLPQRVFSRLPAVIVDLMKCYFGKKLPPCPVSKDVTTAIERCRLLHRVLGSNACTLENWNEYDFDITVAMSSSYWKFGNEGSQVSLHADSTFQDFILKLNIGDQVEFVGALSEGIGSHRPKLQLSSIKCVECKSKLGGVQKINRQINSNIWAVPTFIFNFFLGPTLTM